MTSLVVTAIHTAADVVRSYRHNIQYDVETHGSTVAASKSGTFIVVNVAERSVTEAEPLFL